MSILEIVLLSLLAAGLVTYMTIAIVKAIKKKKNPRDDIEDVE